MDEANRSISCTVEQCKNHSPSENYWALNNDRIGTPEPNPKMSECVDCQSFEQKSPSEK